MGKSFVVKGAVRTAAFVVVGSLFALASSASAAIQLPIIDVQFQTTNVNPQSGPAVVGSSGDVWNQITVAPTGSQALTFVDGSTPSGVTATYTGSQFYTPGVRSSYPDANLYSSYILNKTNVPATGQVTLTGLNTAFNYNVYLYSDCDVDGRVNNFSVTGNSTATGSTTSSTEATTFAAGINYIEFPAVTSNGGTITINYFNSGSTEADLNGIQVQAVVPTPEPACLTLLGLGAAGLLARRRRRTA